MLLPLGSADTCLMDSLYVGKYLIIKLIREALALERIRSQVITNLHTDATHIQKNILNILIPFIRGEYRILRGLGFFCRKAEGGDYIDKALDGGGAKSQSPSLLYAIFAPDDPIIFICVLKDRDCGDRERILLTSKNYMAMHTYSAIIVIYSYIYIIVIQSY